MNYHPISNVPVSPFCTTRIQCATDAQFYEPLSECSFVLSHQAIQYHVRHLHSRCPFVVSSNHGLRTNPRSGNWAIGHKEGGPVILTHTTHRFAHSPDSVFRLPSFEFRVLSFMRSMFIYCYTCDLYVHMYNLHFRSYREPCWIQYGPRPRPEPIQEQTM